MKNLILRLLDAMVPADIKEFEQSEELARARALVVLLLVNVLISSMALVASQLEGAMPSELSDVSFAGLGACIAGYVVALWLFRTTGLFGVSGNIYATVAYVTTLFGALALPSQDAMLLILVLLAMPLLVALVANYTSGLVWLIVVAVTPLLMAQFDERANLSEFLLASWITACVGVLLAIGIGHYYREGIAQRLNSERTRFEFAAAHDALTGLANRATFDRRLRECIEFCTLHGTRAVLAYIDLDYFKPINDTYGHQAGDIVLSTVAERLRHLVRKTDTVARLGGDEFAILFDQCNPEDLAPLLERMAQSVREPIKVFDNQLVVGCSVGVVVCPDDGLHPHQLSHKADERMYDAKRRNRSQAGTA